MEQREESIFPIEEALEMILVFDHAGKISYANAAARQKLGYDNDLCKRHISDVFPNAFRVVEKGFETECTFGNELQNLVAYRKKSYLFPSGGKAGTGCC